MMPPLLLHGSKSESDESKPVAPSRFKFGDILSDESAVSEASVSDALKLPSTFKSATTNIWIEKRHSTQWTFDTEHK